MTTFDISITNTTQHDQQVLTIGDASANQLALTVTNHSETSVRFVAGGPDATSTFAIVFEDGLLTAAQFRALAISCPSGWAAAWSDSTTATGSTRPGWSLAAIADSTLAPGAALVFRIGDVEVSQGPASGTVTVGYHDCGVSDDYEELRLTRVTGGLQALPIGLAVMGKGGGRAAIVVSPDAGDLTTNSLQIAISNNSPQPIAAGPGAAIRLVVPYGNAQQRFALTDEAHTASMQVTILDQADNHWGLPTLLPAELRPAWQGLGVVWELVPDDSHPAQLFAGGADGVGAEPGRRSCAARQDLQPQQRRDRRGWCVRSHRAAALRAVDQLRTRRQRAHQRRQRGAPDGGGRHRRRPRQAVGGDRTGGQRWHRHMDAHPAVRRRHRPAAQPAPVHRARARWHRHERTRG